MAPPYRPRRTYVAFRRASGHPEPAGLAVGPRADAEAGGNGADDDEASAGFVLRPQRLRRIGRRQRHVAVVDGDADAAAVPRDGDRHGGARVLAGIRDELAD